MYQRRRLIEVFRTVYVLISNIDISVRNAKELVHVPLELMHIYLELVLVGT